MRTIFTARRYKAPEDLKVFAEEEVQRLKKYHDSIMECEIILSYEKQTQVAEVKLLVNGQLLTAIEKSENIRKSITLATDKIERQLKKYKGKWNRKKVDRVSFAQAIENQSITEEI